MSYSIIGTGRHKKALAENTFSNLAAQEHQRNRNAEAIETAEDQQQSQMMGQAAGVGAEYAINNYMDSRGPEINRPDSTFPSQQGGQAIDITAETGSVGNGGSIAPSQGAIATEQSGAQLVSAGSEGAAPVYELATGNVAADGAAIATETAGAAAAEAAGAEAAGAIAGEAVAAEAVGAAAAEATAATVAGSTAATTAGTTAAAAGAGAAGGATAAAGTAATLGPVGWVAAAGLLASTLF